MFNSSSAPRWTITNTSTYIPGTGTGMTFGSSTTVNSLCLSCKREVDCRCADCKSLDIDDLCWLRENRDRLHPRLLAEIERLERKWPAA